MYDVTVSDDEPYDQDAELVPIELPELPSYESVYDLVERMARASDRDDMVNATVRDYMEDMFDAFGEDCVVPILSYIQMAMGWDLEILLDKQGVEDYLMLRHSIYDEEIWEKVINTLAINELHHAVYRLSQTFLSDAVAEVLMKEQSRNHPEDDLPK
mgnify:CR=1 FL=1